MGWLGLDDTDTLQGGCTTHLFHLITTKLRSKSVQGAPWELPSYNHLVRLWPSAPNKTRGNAALAVELAVKGTNGEQQLLYELDKLAQEFKLSDDFVPPEGQPPSPVMVWSPTKPPKSWYWDAVRQEVSLSEREEEFQRLEGSRSWSGTRRQGLIGATSAIAWRPTTDSTWEMTAYREVSRTGTKREFSNQIPHHIEKKFPLTLLNRDPTVDSCMLTPRGPCPVLFGVRSTDSQSATDALSWISTQKGVENISSFQKHLTNQASGDHLSGMWECKLLGDVEVLKGGHAFFVAEVEFHQNNINAHKSRPPSADEPRRFISFKQGGDMNSFVQTLKERDTVWAEGLVSRDDSIHLEAIKPISIKPRRVGRPLCPTCDKRMKSKGVGQGLSCPTCTHTLEDIWITIDYCFPEGVDTDGWYRPPVRHRRHLARHA